MMKSRFLRLLSALCLLGLGAAALRAADGPGTAMVVSRPGNCKPELDLFDYLVNAFKRKRKFALVYDSSMHLQNGEPLRIVEPLPRPPDGKTYPGLAPGKFYSFTTTGHVLYFYGTFLGYDAEGHFVLKTEVGATQILDPAFLDTSAIRPGKSNPVLHGKTGEKNNFILLKFKDGASVLTSYRLVGFTPKGDLLLYEGPKNGLENGNGKVKSKITQAAFEAITNFKPKGQPIEIPIETVDAVSDYVVNKQEKHYHAMGEPPQSSTVYSVASTKWRKIADSEELKALPPGDGPYRSSSEFVYSEQSKDKYHTDEFQQPPLKSGEYYSFASADHTKYFQGTLLGFDIDDNFVIKTDGGEKQLLPLGILDLDSIRSGRSNPALHDNGLVKEDGGHAKNLVVIKFKDGRPSDTSYWVEGFAPNGDVLAYEGPNAGLKKGNGKISGKITQNEVEAAQNYKPGGWHLRIPIGNIEAVADYMPVIKTEKGLNGMKAGTTTIYEIELSKWRKIKPSDNSKLKALPPGNPGQ